MQTPRGCGQLDVLDGGEQFGEQQAQGEPGEVRSEAEVLADSEGELRVRRAVDVEGVGVVEYRRIAVRPGVPHQHLVALRDLLASDLDVGGGRSTEVMDRRLPTQYLLDRQRNEIRIRDQPIE